MRLSKELQIGKAGEYMVCADLIIKGFVCYPSEQGLPYDVVLDNGSRLIKIQVKTTTGPRRIPQRATDTMAYIFDIKRAGKNNTKRYEGNEIDVFALVCLDTRMVGYLKSNDMPNTVNFRVDSLRGTYYDEKGYSDYEKINIMKDTHTVYEICSILNLHFSQVYRMLKDGYKPYLTSARYFSDISRGSDWFLKI